MKNTILRILISAILFSLISGIVVAIIGLMLGWKVHPIQRWLFLGRCHPDLNRVYFLQGIASAPFGLARSMWTRLNAPTLGGRHFSWQKPHGLPGDFRPAAVRLVSGLLVGRLF